jgi:hypothetical protein
VDLLTHIPCDENRTSVLSLDDQVRTLLAEMTSLWWSCPRSLPAFHNTFQPGEQADHEKQLERMVEGLLQELRRIPSSAAERSAWSDRLRPPLIAFARQSLRLEQRHIDFIEQSGIPQAGQEFARMARRFDPFISADDIYQAGRNVMSANLIQLILGLPVAVTPSVFAYSMLYPYTDNYLDDASISNETKRAFNRRFLHRLQGERVQPANEYESRISHLVEMIEDQWDRQCYPAVYESLVAIHAAQARSLSMVVPGASPFELDVLGVSFEKGGTSVLADGYLAAGDLTPAQARLLFGYGSFTQLMDDLEDIEQDRQDGRVTVFSQTAPHWPLDALTNRFIHFGRQIFGFMHDLDKRPPAVLDELLDNCLDSILVDTVSRACAYYSREYLKAMETHLAFRFSALKRQRDKLARHKVGMGRLIEILM